jgi:hypothetical protein
MSDKIPPDLHRKTQDRGDLSSGTHSVQFYSNGTFLLDALSRFIGSAVGVGDAGIVIATESHRTELRGIELGVVLKDHTLATAVAGPSAAAAAE